MKIKKFEKLFTEDFDKSYNVSYDKEEVLKHFVVKEKVNKPVKTKLILKYVMVLLIGVFIGVGIGYPINDLVNDNEIITKEFEEFGKENGDQIKIENYVYTLMIDGKYEIHIFKKENRDYYNYYYIAKTNKNGSHAYLMYNNEKNKITHNSFGLLDTKQKDESQTIEFYIEIDGEIKQFILN